MATTDYTAFEGRVIFHCRHESLRTLRDVQRMKSDALAAGMGEDDAIYLVDMLELTTRTDDISFHFKDDETGMLRELQKFWKAYKKSVDYQAVLDFRLDVSGSVIGEWRRAQRQAETPFYDPATVPPHLLTPAERAEADNPDSPLEESV